MYSTFSIRRRRDFALRLIIIFLCICLFLQTKYNLFNSSNDKLPISNTKRANLLVSKPLLDCVGDPLQQWCENEVTLCHPHLVVYNKLFAVTRSVVLQPNLAAGKRTGGETIHDVLNQPEQDEYFHFQQHFIKLPCHVPRLSGHLSHNHILQIFSSIETYTIDTSPELVNETTIAVRRQDYVNFYHTITDLYTVYTLCRFFKQDPKSVRILFIDAHPKGNLDLFWSQLFHSYTRLGHLKNTSSILYRQLIWSQPQAQSEIDTQQDRRVAPSFFFDFREHVLKHFDINYRTNTSVDCQSVKIFFLVRHNYVAHPRNPSGRITRQLTNEKEILAELMVKFSQHPHINFSSNHFEEMSIVDQLKIIVETDVFVGIHGAGLTHTVFLKSNRALIELVGNPQTGTHFDLLASMNGVNYHRCLIRAGSAATTQTIYKCIMKKLSEMCPSTTKPTMSTESTKTTSTFVGNVSSSIIKN